MKRQAPLEPTLTDEPVAKNMKAAWEIQETYEGKPHGWLQWKGTDACIDIHCKCGKSSHFHGEFMYAIQCPYCNRKYFTNGHIQLIEILECDTALQVSEAGQ